MDWMIFYKEASNTHFIWDSPRATCLAIGLEITTQGDLFSRNQRTLDDALRTPRVKVFKLDGARYGIVAKGQFHID